MGEHTESLSGISESPQTLMDDKKCAKLMTGDHRPDPEDHFSGIETIISKSHCCFIVDIANRISTNQEFYTSTRVLEVSSVHPPILF